MTKKLLIICILLTHNVFGQAKYKIKLFDSYSSTQIKLNNSFLVQKAKFTIDTINNEIQIFKIKGKNLKISSDKYKIFEEKIAFKKYKNKTLPISLEPSDSFAYRCYLELWNVDKSNKDTLIFDSKAELSTLLNSYLKYMLLNDFNCDNEGLCNHSRTYYYQLSFSSENSIFKITKVSNIHYDPFCEELDLELNKIRSIFPKFILKIQEENLNEFKMNFLIYR